MKMTKFILGAQLAKKDTAIKRAAVVPYVVMKDESGASHLHFLLARDNQTGDITDFGGGVKQNEVALSAALREFKEESDEIFGSLYDGLNSASMHLAMIGNSMSVLFIPLSSEWYSTAPSLFNDKRSADVLTKKRSHSEVSELIWFDEREFKNLISPRNKKMWSRVRRFYHQNYSDEIAKALKLIYCA